MDTKYKIEDFEIDFMKPLGKGGFSEVYKATEKKTGKVYAIKRFSKENLFKEELDNMELMNKYKCENSVKYFGSFEYENFIYLIMEKCDISLDKIKDKKLSIKTIKEILEQLNNVFKIMSDKSIIHRDIKPQNILINKLGNNKFLYKLTDYGFSKQLTKSHKAKSKLGTDDYIAPEIINDPDGKKSKVVFMEHRNSYS
jgi:serine/threonine protein kinase